MKIVRDLTKPKTEYKGHQCYALDADCPCRPCFICHDCTRTKAVQAGKPCSDVFHCATNWNKGCPEPRPEPQHDLNRLKRCKRCGQVINKNGKPKQTTVATPLSYSPIQLFENWRHYASPENKNCNGVSLTEDMILKWSEQKEPKLECVFCGRNGSSIEMSLDGYVCCPICREYKGIQPYIQEWSDWG